MKSYVLENSVELLLKYIFTFSILYIFIFVIFVIIYVFQAKKYNSEIYYGDRPVDVTTKRVLAALSWRKSFVFLAHLLFTKNRILK